MSVGGLLGLTKIAKAEEEKGVATKDATKGRKQRWSNKKVNIVQVEPIFHMGVARKKRTSIFCAKTIILCIVCHENIDANQGNEYEV